MENSHHVRQVQSKKGFIAPLLLIIIALLAAGGGAYVYVQKSQTNVPMTESLSTATSTTQVSDSQTADWKTYTNSDLGFSIKYPANWKIDTLRSNRAQSGNDVVFTTGIAPDHEGIAVDATTSSLESWAERVRKSATNEGSYQGMSSLMIDGQSAIQVDMASQGKLVGVVFSGKLYVFATGGKMVENGMLSTFKFITTTPTEKVSNQSVSTLLADVIGKNEGKYPSDIKLFSNREIVTRLKVLLGAEYETMLQNFTVQTPIVGSGGIYKVTGCAAHACSAYLTQMFFDVKKDNINVIIDQNGVIEKFKEKELTIISGGINFSIQNSSTAQIADWTTYTNGKYGFSFKYPPNWFIRETPDQDILDFSKSELSQNDSEGLKKTFVQLYISDLILGKENSGYKAAPQDYFNAYYGGTQANASSKWVTLNEKPVYYKQDVTTDQRILVDDYNYLLFTKDKIFIFKVHPGVLLNIITGLWQPTTYEQKDDDLIKQVIGTLSFSDKNVEFVNAGVTKP